MLSSLTLPQLGWRTHFSLQVSLDDLTTCFAARVASVHRDSLSTVGECGACDVHLPKRLGLDLSANIAVGDWVLVERATERVARVLDRYSVLQRQAAGTDQRAQLIAANVDVMFVVTSCNDDFNLSRLERYLALALHAQVEPVVVLTKADLCDDVDARIDDLRSISRAACVAINATDVASIEYLSPWLQQGQAIVIVGSSGVGKSTLTNKLLGQEQQLTSSIREDDSKGRHTTTARELLLTSFGTWIIDTPGMRELKIGAIETGVSLVFDDIDQLGRRCHFRDCAHENEKGCAVLVALANGALDERRLVNYRKLKKEAARASRTLAQQREIDRHWGRVHRSAQKVRRKERGRE